MTYRRTVTPHQAGLAAISALKTQARLDVSVNGHPVGVITPLAPTLWIGELAAGDELAVTASAQWGESLGELRMLTGQPVQGWTVHRQDATTLGLSRDVACFRSAEYPVDVPPGGATWVRIPRQQLDRDSTTVVRAEGTGLLATALIGQEILGRLWVGAMIPGASLRGGKGDLLLVPASGNADLDLLLEATGRGPGVLSQLMLGGPIDCDGG
jgi:hypothetical protein